MCDDISRKLWKGTFGIEDVIETAASVKNLNVELYPVLYIPGMLRLG